MNDSITWRLQGKRVGMVVFSFYPEDPRPRRAAEALAGQGMEVDLICLAEKAGEPRREVLNGVAIRRLPVTRNRGSFFRYGVEYVAFLLATAAILAKRTLIRRYDLIYIHNMPDILVLSGLIPKLLGAKVILDLHDPMPELMITIFGLRPGALAVRLIRWLERSSIAIADSVVTVNRACARLFTSRSCPARKMHVVMNSPDERIFHPHPPQVRLAASDAPGGRFVIMYHGSLVERNGLDVGIKALAWALPSVPAAKLRVYGRQTPYLKLAMDLAREQGVEGAVEYLGHRSLERLVDAIDECDVGIIPNRQSIFTELNTPTRIFEYLTLGKPVIAPRAAGICDYFDDAAIIFFELGNERDLAEKIAYVSSHPREAAEITRRGQEVCREHSWRKEKQRLLGLVAGLLNAESIQIGAAADRNQSESAESVSTSSLE
jgi:glycosyltransferase involved in cell wall biosynthesis